MIPENLDSTILTLPILGISARVQFAAAHASIHNHFHQDRHLNSRDIFKQNRAAALAEWRELMA